MKRTYVLCILDGWGLAEAGPFNTLSQAYLPTWNYLWANYPHSILEASADAVGLPAGQMGNSEVGHMTIGAGRCVYQDLPRIDHALKDKSIFHHAAVDKLLNIDGTIHLMGLVSPGGVHSHIHHMQAFADYFKEKGKNILLHAFLDGRDCPPQSALSYMSALPSIPVATLSGRYFSMDRDQRWERTQQAYQTIIKGLSETRFDAVTDYIQQCYAQGVSDEFIPPASHSSYKGISPNDGIFFFNFRADRVRQLLAACIDPAFTSFPREVFKGTVVGMTDYGKEWRPYYEILFSPDSLPNTLGEVVAKAGLTQLRLAETEKYAHVTFFFNGGREELFSHETRNLIPSPSVATYDLCPEMSAHTLTDVAVKTITEGNTDLIVMNYANADMVGHTGHQEAACQAVEVVDECLKRLYDTLHAHQGVLVITADHGNIEKMVDHNQQPHTAHTLNHVPFVIVDPAALRFDLIPQGTLADIAPTLLKLMELEIPPEMTGNNLIKKTKA